MASLMDVYTADDMFGVMADSGAVTVWKVLPNGGLTIVSDKPKVSLAPESRHDHLESEDV